MKLKPATPKAATQTPAKRNLNPASAARIRAKADKILKGC